MTARARERQPTGLAPVMRIFVTVDGDLSKRTGQRTHVIQLCTELAKQGHEVCLFTHSANTEEDRLPFAWMTVRVIPIFHGISYQLSLLLYLLWRGARARPTLMYARTLAYTFSPALVARMLKVPLILEVNGFVLDEVRMSNPDIKMWRVSLTRVLEGWRCRVADQIIVVTDGLAELLENSYGLEMDKITVIPNGVDTKLFTVRDARASKRRLGLCGDESHVCFVGSLVKWQGVETLVRASARVLQEFPGVRFLVVGDGPERDKLEALAQSLGTAGQFCFTGYLAPTRVAEHVSASDVCVAPFTADRNQRIGLSPLKVFEYMASARPIVASNVRGLEVLEQQRAGLLVEPDNISALANGIVRLLRHAAVRQQMGRNGRRLVGDHLTWAATARKVACVCRDVAQQHSRGHPLQRGGPRWPDARPVMRPNLASVVEQKEHILALSHLRHGPYAAIRPDEAIQALFQRYVLPLGDYLNIEGATLLDCGCGYGWLGLAYVLAGGEQAVMIDLDLDRLRACRQIAEIIGVGDRLLFICGDITALPVGPRCTDVFSSVQTLEHLRNDGAVRTERIAQALREIVRATRCVIVVNTPNALFPIDRHDTGLPFAHWLPQAPRCWYARAFGRTEDREFDNIFVSIFALESNLRPFRRASTYKCFSSFDEYWANRWRYSPYGRGVLDAPQSNAPGRPGVLDAAARLLGKWYRYLAPTIEGIYVREG